MKNFKRFYGSFICFLFLLLLRSIPISPIFLCRNNPRLRFYNIPWCILHIFRRVEKSQKKMCGESACWNFFGARRSESLLFFGSLQLACFCQHYSRQTFFWTKRIQNTIYLGIQVHCILEITRQRTHFRYSVELDSYMFLSVFLNHKFLYTLSNS